MKIERLPQDEGAAARNFELIAEAFPSAVTEAVENGKTVRKIDLDALKLELPGATIDKDTERYSFMWPNKKNALIAANQPADCALRPCAKASSGKTGTPGEFDSGNVYIEGDNLDALKLLQETYLGRVKMIYIDPPYNTGHDFVYRDNYTQTEEEYKESAGDYNKSGERLVTNSDTDGRFHTNWLNMIYPRLTIARNLLSDDGVIFISIDDHEVHNLRKVCDEVFGEENFAAQFNWRGRGGRQDSKYFVAIHEYILCYARHIGSFVAGEEIVTGEVYPKFDEKLQRRYKTQLLRKWGSNSRRVDRPNLYYPIKAPDGTDLYPMVPSGDGVEEGCWRWGKDTMAQAIEENRVDFIKQPDGSWIAYEKIFEPKKGEEKTKKYVTWIDNISTGTKGLQALFDGVSPFDYSKSPELLIKFLKMGNASPDALVLDFFSGSASTAHAVMELNAQDGGRRKFIMVQIPEKCAPDSDALKMGYSTICEIGEERIRRAGRKIVEEHPDAAEKLDIGFRVFKIGSPNLKETRILPQDTTQEMLLNLEDNIKEGRTPEDLLIQAMLSLGIPLDAEISRESSANTEDKLVFTVRKRDSEDLEPGLIACFDSDVSEDVASYIAHKHPVYAVFCDRSFMDDAARVNFDRIFGDYAPQTKLMVL